ncbi:MAG: flagellar hook protein FlgE [Pseudomonadota bacterium]
MAFETAVSGIKAAAADLSIIGNNVANSSTSGFKSSSAQFADVFTTSLLGTGSNQVGKGVTLTSVNQEFAQGNISFTSSSLDLAINGSGFFVLSDDGARLYSRAGNFSVDRDGFIVNNTGKNLQGISADANGDLVGQVGDLRIDSSLISPNPTGNVDVGINLDSRETAPLVPWGGPFNAFASPPTSPDPSMFNASTSMTIFDGQGVPHALGLFFAKTATPNEWDVHAMIDGVSVAGPDTVTFDPNGQFPTASLPVDISIAGWTPLNEDGTVSGSAVQSLTVDISNATQLGSAFAVSSVTQDGFSSGQLRGVEIDSSGIMFARYTNGQSRPFAQVSMANFSNPNGLQAIGDTSWSETAASGAAVVTGAGTSGLGVIQSGALEDSNVELTEQLVQMIVAQRNFQANAQTIQTEDAITQTIINLR